ncbi:MAG TPA: beta-ketoacyl synthase N-terminal-like domain-containing protein, partial [Thermodesulfovibrionales bacterium]|nr:beta-ketoacyl synthase N-terminal-like domain-containing protein [Thermodesulfovibrionales bacterium]
MVVTGVGAVTPLGNTFEKSWVSMLSGTPGVRGITRFSVTSIPWKAAGEIAGFVGETFLSRKELNRLDLFVQYAVAAAVMAAEDAGLIGWGESQVTSLKEKTRYSPLVTRRHAL